MLRFSNAERLDDKVVVFRDALAADSCALFDAYVRVRLGAGDFMPEAKHASSALYGDALAESLLDDATPAIEEFMGGPLYPFYAYLRVYREGSRLEPHIDRDHCDYTLSVALSSQSEEPWPFEVAGIDQQVVLNRGDAVLVEGRTRRHWRPGAAPAWSMQAFLHWTRRADQIFDGRMTLGTGGLQH